MVTTIAARKQFDLMPTQWALVADVRVRSVHY